MSGRPTFTPLQRILAAIDATGPCWLWTGRPCRHGGGSIFIEGRRWRAHRAVYAYLVDAIPDGHDVIHTCGRQMCVTPDHLRAVPRYTRLNTRPAAETARAALADATGSGSMPDADADVDWRHRAACRGEDPELFFPLGDSPAARAQANEAKDVCKRCPSVQACLAWALESGQDAGVWGAMSEDERRQLKRRRVRPSRAKASA